MPMAMARPPKDIRLAVRSNRSITKNVTSGVTMSVAATIKALLVSPRNSEQHDHHQENTLPQRLIDGLQSGGDQFDTIVKGNDPPSCRQQPLVLYLGDLDLDAFYDVAGVSAAQHEHDPCHYLTLTVQDGGAMTNGMADLYLGDVMDVHGSAAHFLDDDVLDVAQFPDQSHTADDVLFSMFLQHVARSIRVVVRHSGKHLAQ